MTKQHRPDHHSRNTASAKFIQSLNPNQKAALYDIIHAAEMVGNFDKLSTAEILSYVVLNTFKRELEQWKQK